MALAPCLFQRRVAKAYELRVTLVGEQLFSARIESQELPEARLDWRRAQSELRYTAAELSTRLAAQIRALARRFGLVYGAFDLAVTPEGDAVFFEVNPTGQWLWLEHSAGLPITSAIAGWLSGASSRTAR